MTVGCFGNFQFSVSSDYVRTFDSLSLSASARYSTHARHGSVGLLEFTGVEPAEISFEVYLDVSLGISDVMREVDKLGRMMKNGEVRALVIGNKSYGAYRWVLTNYKVVPRSYAGNGVVTSAKVSLTLKEYLRG